jgi:hypothetical protein
MILVVEIFSMYSNSATYPSALQILGRAIIAGVGSHFIGAIIYALILPPNSYYMPGHLVVGMGSALGFVFGIVTGSVLVIATGVIWQEKYSRAMTYFSMCVMFAVFFFYMHLMSPLWWQLLITVIIGIIGSWSLTHWVLDIPYAREKRKISY